MSWRSGDWPDAAELAKIREEATIFAGVGLYRYLLDGTVIFLDQGAFDLLDLDQLYPDPSAVLGVNISDLYTPVLKRGILRSAVSAQGEVRGFEYPYRTLTGEERWAYHHAYRVRDPETGLEAVQVISQDITTLKHAVHALAASERQYRSLAEQSLQGLLVIQGSPATLRFANAAAAKLLLRPPDALQSMSASSLASTLHPKERSWWHDQIRRLERGGLEVQQRDLRVMLDGTVARWLTVLSGPIEFQGQEAFQIVLVDDTARRRAQARRQRVEERMRQAQKLESLGVLAGGIAHDFNNLLAAILGNTQLAATDLDAGSTAHARLTRVEEAASRAADLCQQLLAYSGRGSFSKEVLDLKALIIGTSELLRVSISSAIRLHYSFDEQVPYIQGDASQIRQVFMNLLINASEAVVELRREVGAEVGDAGVRFTVRACHLDRSFLDEHSPGETVEPGPFVLVEVEDNGVGMRPEVTAQVFEPFFSTKFAGRGLGLAAVKGIMAGHGGLILVESEFGKGSRFCCYFPAGAQALALAGATPEPDAASDTALHPGVGRVALVVDDDPAVREMASEALDLLGFEVLQAESGHDAIRMLGQVAPVPNLVLLDLTMPGLSGHETFVRLRELQPDLPVLFSSGFDEQTLPIDLCNERAAAFLQKPYRLADLGRAIAALNAAAEPPLET